MSDYALVEGMAVTHDRFGSGEIIEIYEDTQLASVEFGEVGVTYRAWLHELDVDWEFYRDGESVHKDNA